MTTLNRHTGGIVDGFDEVLQSIEVIFSTRKGTRVMRRDFGSDGPRLVDRAVAPLSLIDYYAAIADACRQEPRFRLAKMKLAEDSDVSAGAPIFDVEGLWYPRGHLGDFSEVRDASGRLVLSDEARRL